MMTGTLGFLERNYSASSSPVELDFDFTFLVQMGLFVVLYLILKPLLFEPILELFKERERLTEETVKKANAMDDESVHAKNKYDAAMSEVRKDATETREKICQEGVRHEADLLLAARTTSAKKMEEGRALSQRELETAKQQLESGARDLARELASRALGREVQG